MSTPGWLVSRRVAKLAGGNHPSFVLKPWRGKGGACMAGARQRLNQGLLAGLFELPGLPALFNRLFIDALCFECCVRTRASSLSSCAPPRRRGCRGWRL